MVKGKFGKNIGKSQNIMELIVEDQNFSTESLLLLAESVLKNIVFEHIMRYFKQLQGTAKGNKFAPPFFLWVIWKIKF